MFGLIDLFVQTFALFFIPGSDLVKNPEESLQKTIVVFLAAQYLLAILLNRKKVRFPQVMTSYFGTSIIIYLTLITFGAPLFM